jgi:hypothetical protein
LRLGHDVAVINMSRDGILIEGSARLRPGYRVELQMDTSATYLHALIARCEVSVLDENGVTYRAGLTFIDRARQVLKYFARNVRNAAQSAGVAAWPPVW